MCDWPVDFTAGDVINAESLHGGEIANMYAESWRNISAK